MRRLFPSLTVLLVLLLGLVAAEISPAADPAAAKAAAKVLLDTGWDKTVAARKIADECDLNSPPLKGDSFVAAAHWLVLMYQGRPDEALVSLDKFFAANPANASNLSALRAKAWIYAAKKDFPRAIAAARSLAQAVSLNPPAAEAAIPESHADAIEFLGHLAGFLEGPVERTADQNARKKFEAEVLARWNEPRKKVFEDAKADVLAEFQQLVGGATEAVQKAKEATEAEKKQSLEKLSKEAEKLSKDAGDVEEKAKQLAAEVKTKLDNIQREATPLLGTHAALQFQWNSMSQQLSQQRADARRLQQQANTEQKNVQLRQQFQNDQRRAQLQADSTQRQVNDLNGRIVMVQTRLMALDQESQRLGGAAISQGQQLENQKQNVEREKLRNENKQKRTERLKAAGSGKAASLETEARAFRTYDTYPLDELRDTLLKNVQ